MVALISSQYCRYIGIWRITFTKRTREEKKTTTSTTNTTDCCQTWIRERKKKVVAGAVVIILIAIYLWGTKNTLWISLHRSEQFTWLRIEFCVWKCARRPKQKSCNVQLDDIDRSGCCRRCRRVEHVSCSIMLWSTTEKKNKITNHGFQSVQWTCANRWNLYRCH